MENALRSYNIRRQKWKEGLSPATKYMAQLTDSVLIEHFYARGYKVLPYKMSDPKNLVERNVIILEKIYFDHCTIQFSFDKYDRPRFQVNLIKRDSSNNFKIVDSSNVVANSNQYVHFWGKPWWLPEILWPKCFSSKQIEKIIRLTPQIEAFFEHGERGENISPIVEGCLQK